MGNEVPGLLDEVYDDQVDIHLGYGDVVGIAPEHIAAFTLLDDRVTERF